MTCARYRELLALRAERDDLRRIASILDRPSDAEIVLRVIGLSQLTAREIHVRTCFASALTTFAALDVLVADGRLQRIPDKHPKGRPPTYAVVGVLDGRRRRRAAPQVSALAGHTRTAGIAAV